MRAAMQGGFVKVGREGRRSSIVFCIQQVSSAQHRGKPLQPSTGATLSRRQLCASQHLFVSGCQEIMDWDVVTFISLIVTPCEIVKCDKRERQESRSRDSCLLLGPPALSFFFQTAAKVCGKQSYNTRV